MEIAEFLLTFERPENNYSHGIVGDLFFNFKGGAVFAQENVGNQQYSYPCCSWKVYMSLELR